MARMNLEYSALLLAIAPSSVCLAQFTIGTATITWQASIDDGSTWRSGNVDVEFTQPRVLVRALVDWSRDAGVAYATSTFDVQVSDVAPGDSVSNMRRPSPLDQYHTQTIVSSRFAGTILKIDDENDMLPPGLGALGVLPIQITPNFGGPFTDSRPLSIFEFEFTHDGTLGRRGVTQFFTQGPTEGPQTVRTWRSRSGTQNIPQFMTVQLGINVIPSPAAASVATLCALLAATRRHRTPTNFTPSPTH